tara:strand:+ start:135 stop:1934 length:1800 start_codon:yes stop_codon:yes gene_type:complete
LQKISGYQKRNNEGFTVIELSVVMTVMATTMAIGIPVYQGMQEKAMLEAAKQSLYAMKSECERNYAHGTNNLSQPVLRGYTIQSSTSNCDVLRAVANNSEKHPSFAYDFSTGKFSCNYKNFQSTPFPECKKIGGKTAESNNASQSKNVSLGKAVPQQKVDKTPELSLDEYIAKLDAEVEKELKAKEEALAKAKAEKQPNCDPRTGIVPTGKGLAKLGAITPCPESVWKWYETRGINTAKIPVGKALPKTKEEYLALLDTLKLEADQKDLVKETRISKLLKQEKEGSKFCWKRYVSPGRVYTGAIDPAECSFRKGQPDGDSYVELTKSEYEELALARKAEKEKEEALAKKKLKEKIEVAQKDLDDYLADIDRCSSESIRQRSMVMTYPSGPNGPKVAVFSEQKNKLVMAKLRNCPSQFKRDDSLIAKQQALAESKFAASPEGIAKAKAKAEKEAKAKAEEAAHNTAVAYAKSKAGIQDWQEFSRLKSKDSSYCLPLPNEYAGPEKIVCGPDSHVTSVKSFNLQGAKKWFCDTNSAKRIQAGTGTSNDQTCAEQHNQLSCMKGYNDCIKNYVDPTRKMPPTNKGSHNWRAELQDLRKNPNK